MLTCNLLLKISVTLAVVYSLPMKTVKRSSDLDTEEITDKLSKLKNLLEKLENVRKAKANLENKMKESGSDSRELGNEFHGKIADNFKNGMAHSDNLGTQEDIINLKKLDNVQKLKLLRELVSEAKNMKNENFKDEGTFADDAVPESKERADAADWKDLAKRLEGERDSLYLQNLKRNEKPIHIETETKEGSFGEFRDEIKYAVEKNLLSDIALAMHSGISVEEMLKDLIAEGNARSPDVVWTKRDGD